MILGFLTNYFSEKNLEKRRKEIYSKQNALEQEIAKLEEQKHILDKKIIEKIKRSECYYKIYTDTANTVMAHVYDFFNTFNNNVLPDFYDLLKRSVTINCSKNEINLIKDNIDLLNKDIETAERMIDLYGYFDNTKQIYDWLIKNHSYALWVNDNRERLKKPPQSASTINNFLKEILNNLDKNIIGRSERDAVFALMQKLRISYKYKHIIRALRSAVKYYKKKKYDLFDEIKRIKETLEGDVKKHDELAVHFSKRWKEMVKKHNNICRGFKKAEELKLKIGYICSQKNIATEELQERITDNYDVMNRNNTTIKAINIKIKEITIEIENIKSEQKDEVTRLHNLDHGDDDTANKIKTILKDLSNDYNSLYNNRYAFYDTRTTLITKNGKLSEEINRLKKERKNLFDAFNKLMENYIAAVSSIFSFPKEIEKKLPENIYSYRIKQLFFLDNDYTKKADQQKTKVVNTDTQGESINPESNTQPVIITRAVSELFKLIWGIHQ